MAQRLSVAPHELGGCGPLLLLLHANGFHGRIFLPMLPVLAPHFRCVALDLPGHGIAPAPKGPITAEGLVAAVREYVDEHGIHGCYCFGHSLGGCMAAMLELERPGTFRAMYLYEPVISSSYQLPPAPPTTSSPLPPPSTEHGTVVDNNPAAAPSTSTFATFPTAVVSVSGSAERAAAPEAVAASGQERGRVAAAVSQGGGGSPSRSPSASKPAGIPGNLLARMARKRQSTYFSVEAAKAALGSKPPFNAFHPDALHAYLACGGLLPMGPRDVPTAGPAPAHAPAASLAWVTAPAAAREVADPLITASSRSGGDGGGGVTLSCAPETEARIFEALTQPPWRPWHKLATGRRVGAVGTETEGSSSSRGGSGGSGGCRVALAVGRMVPGGVHSQLAKWSAEVAEQIPGAHLIRFPSLQHLGPMEDPIAVAQSALAFFATGNGVAEKGSNSSNCKGACDSFGDVGAAAGGTAWQQGLQEVAALGVSVRSRM